MAQLKSPLEEQVEFLRAKSFTLLTEGNYEEREKVLLEAWELLPLPKEQWEVSFTLAYYLINGYIKMNTPLKAKKWAEIIFDPERKSHGERELYAGIVAYELGDFEKAREYFDIVQKDSGGRLWKRPNVMKYCKFYKEKK